MKHICSKTKQFSFLPVIDGARIGQFAASEAKAQAAYINGEDLKEYAIQITVSVVRANHARIGDATYERLLKKRIEENGTSAWYNGPNKYLFDFKERKFMWGNRDLYLTPSQQYDLYGCLVLGEGVDRSMITTLRTKFGKDFLEGFL